MTNRKGQLQREDTVVRFQVSDTQRLGYNSLGFPRARCVLKQYVGLCSVRWTWRRGSSLVEVVLSEEGR